MIVIYGTRSAGRVHGRDGEYALTRFAHIYWMPLFPIGGLWKTEGGTYRAKIQWKSVVAAYARTWGVLATIALCAGGELAAGVVGGAAAALSWAWWNVRGDEAQRRSDLNLASFGIRCEPTAMPDDLVVRLRAAADERWARLSQGQSPSDIARFGTDDPDRAAAAYAVLRLTALELPRAQAAEAEADAARIAAGYRESSQLGEGGPYRRAQIAASTGPASPPPNP